MAALPYMQLYVADYLADTSHLTTVEHGAYLLLMFNYWQRGHSFKAKDEQSLNKRLATVARMSNEEWTEVSETLQEFFNVSATEWRHERIERDLEAVYEKSSKASAAGKASAASKRNKKPAPVPPDDPTNAQRTLERTLNHTDTDTDNNSLSPAHEPDHRPQAESHGDAPFAMHLDWVPGQKRLKAYAVRAGIPIAMFSKEAISGFVLHHDAKGLIKSDAEWVSSLVSWIKRDQASAAENRAGGNVRPFPARQSAEAPDFEATGWLGGE